MPNFKQGDWICICGDHQFAKNTNCRQCGKPRGDGSKQSRPSNFQVGDWLCGKCKSHNYKSRIECRDCGNLKNSFISFSFV